MNTLHLVRFIEDGELQYIQKKNPIEEKSFDNYSERLSWATCKIGDTEVNTASIHAPIIKNRVFPHLSNIFDEIEANLENKSFIVGGDLNSARLAEQVWPNYGHGPFFKRLENSPFFDCIMKFYDKEQQTYFRNGVILPWQDDHLFVSHDLADKVSNCMVLNNNTTRMVSDHIPIIAELNI